MFFGLNDVGFLAAVAGGGAAPWTPANITTSLWLDAADASTVTTVSSAVSQWDDKSGNGRNAAQATAGNRPAYQLAAQNGLNAVRFTAASQHFLTAGTNSTWNFLHDGTNSAVFIVSRCRSTGDNPNAVHTYLSTGGAGSSNIGLWIAYDDLASASRNNGLNVRVAQGAGIYASFDNTNDKITPGTYHLISSYIDADNATLASRTVQRVDGSASFSSNTANAVRSTSNSTSALNIGKDVATPVLDFTGDICEILIFNNQPGTTDRQKLEGYLAHKWGLTANLPNNHPYKTAAPTV
jgi:hypothetical protein